MFNLRQNDKSKQQSFINQITSGNGQTPQSSMINIFSPRNLIKYISTTIDQYNTKPKIYKPDAVEQQQFLNSFQQYWLKIERQYTKHISQKGKKVSYQSKQSKNEQLQYRLILERIPKSYFEQKYELFIVQKFNKLALKRKQQEIAEYLDEIEMLIFNKTSKNPEKYFNCIGNFDETIQLVEKSLTKVKNYRNNQQKKLQRIIRSQLRIKMIHRKKQNINLTLSYIQSMKNLKSIRQQSQNSMNNPNSDSTQQKTERSRIQQKLSIMQNVKKKQLQICSKINSLQKIVNNLEFYRQELKNLVYQQFNKQIIQIMNKILAYEKESWYNTKINAKMLGKQFQCFQNNMLEQSRLNITILDQSYFGINDHHSNLNDHHSNLNDHHSNLNDHDQNFRKTSSHKDQSNNLQVLLKKINEDSESLKRLLDKLNKIWQSIVKFDLYDQEQINEVIMRQLVRHNVLFNKDLDQYLTKVYDQFIRQNQKKQQMRAILEQDLENQDESQKSKEISSTEQNSQQVQQEKHQVSTPNKNKYLQTLSQLTGINDIKDLGDLSQLKKKTINTFKRFGNMKKIGQVLGSSQETHVPGTDSYRKLKESQTPEKKQKANIQTQEKLSRVDTKFFLKAVKFYYQILSSLAKFIHQNSQLIFFQNFLDKFYSFIEERVKFFFSLRHINQSTPVQDFLLYLNLIQYWYDVCDDVYENLSKLKSSITDQYLTVLQKHALVSQLKKTVDQSTYLPCNINSSYINSFYYVFFWASIQQLKKHEAINMSLTILRDQNNDFLSKQASEENLKGFDMMAFQSQFKILDRKIVYKKDQFLICQSFMVLAKQLERYLQLREALTQFNTNIQEKMCQIVGFYVWYNLKNINKTGTHIKPRSLKNLCTIHSTISFLEIVFSQQLRIQNKKFSKTLDQFHQFFKNIDNNITMTPFLLIEQQISSIYQNNALSSQFQIPCKQTSKILEILKLCLEQLKIHFNKQKITKILEPSIKVIMKNYFGYLSSLGKRGLLQIKQFLPKYKQLLLNYGFKDNKAVQPKQALSSTHIFSKEISQMQNNFKSKISQLK